jgi:hypothetical protein
MSSPIPKSALPELIRHFVEKCPACGSAQPVGLVEIIKDEKHILLARLVCRACQSALLTRIHVLPHGLWGSVLMTDLEAGELRRFCKEPPVNLNHVLDAHTLDGERLRHLLSPPEKR